MAKPKLSTEEKAALREELKKRLGGGEPAAKVLQELASKFKVSPETVRYHGKQVAANGAAMRGTAAAKAKRMKAGRRRNGVRKARRAVRRAAGLGDLVRQYDTHSLERAVKASKLYQELQAQRDRSKSLQVELRGSKRAAAKLERQIKRLVRA